MRPRGGLEGYFSIVTDRSRRTGESQLSRALRIFLLISGSTGGAQRAPSIALCARLHFCTLASVSRLFIPVLDVDGSTKPSNREHPRTYHQAIEICHSTPPHSFGYFPKTPQRCFRLRMGKSSWISGRFVSGRSPREEVALTHAGTCHANAKALLEDLENNGGARYCADLAMTHLSWGFSDPGPTRILSYNPLAIRLQKRDNFPPPTR